MDAVAFFKKNMTCQTSYVVYLLTNYLFSICSHSFMAIYKKFLSLVMTRIYFLQYLLIFNCCLHLTNTSFTVLCLTVGTTFTRY